MGSGGKPLPFFMPDVCVLDDPRQTRAALCCRGGRYSACGESRAKTTTPDLGTSPVA